MTVDVYGHLIPGFNKQAVDKLDDRASGISTEGLGPYIDRAGTSSGRVRPLEAIVL